MTLGSGVGVALGSGVDVFCGITGTLTGVGMRRKGASKVLIALMRAV